MSVCHINNPSFADDYYEAILVYAMYGKTFCLYPVGLVLGGNSNTITAGVTRRGTQLVEVNMKLREYNSPLTSALYQAPAPGKYCVNLEQLHK